MSEWLALLPAGIALAATVLALAVDAFGRTALAVALVALGLAGASVSAFVLAAQGAEVVAFDAFAYTTALWSVSGVVFAVGSLALIGGHRSLREVGNGGQLACLTGLAAAAAGVLPAALDLVIVLIVLEVVALTGYAMVSGALSRRADEAAMKYFLQGAVATALMVYALAVVYGSLGGALSLPAVSEAVTSGSRAALTAFALLVAGLAYKLGAFPFHSWAPDAYETAPAPMTAFMASAPKLAVLAVLLLLFPGLFARAEFLPGMWVLAALAAASIVFGNLGGLKQLSYPRMLAYSGIAQVGYALVGVSVMQLGDGPTSFPVLMLGSAYAIAACGAFLASAAFSAADPEWDGTVGGLAGVGKRRPALSAAVTVCLLSLTGIPLTAGFWGKFLVFGSAVAAGGTWLAVIGVIGSVVSFGYYGGVIRAMYLDEPRWRPEAAAAVGADVAKPSLASDRLAEAVVSLVAVAILVGGVLPLFDGLQLFGRLLTLPLFVPGS